MLDVAFSHSYYYKLDPKQWKNKTPYPPLGTIYAAAQVRAQNYKVGLYDTNLLDNIDTFESYLEEKDPQYLVIYDDGFNYLTKMCLVNMREAAFRMIQLAKQKQITVIVGSSDSTDQYEKYLDAGADFILKGEGEFTLCELIDSLEKKEGDVSHILGLIYKENDFVMKTGSRPVLKKLDTLAQPAWDLVDVDAYKDVWKLSGKPFTLNIATTRGCPYKCNWCAKPIYGNRYNSHSPEYIVEQIKYHKTHFGTDRFWMCDDIFGLKPNWVQNFSQLLKENKMKINFYMQSRVDLLLKDDTIEALSQSGLEEVWLGAESGSQEILDAMDKGTEIEQIYQATKKLKAHKIKVAFFLQFGYLGEKWQDIKKTLKMVLDLMPDNIGVSVSYPLPGTKFFDMVQGQLDKKANWNDSDDLDLMFENTYKPIFYKTLHRYVHNRYRIKKGGTTIKNLFLEPFNALKRLPKDIGRMVYHMPLAIYHRYLLFKYAKLK